MYVENHSILKRCEVCYDRGNMNVFIEDNKQIVPVLTGEYANLRKLCANGTQLDRFMFTVPVYKLGMVEIRNQAPCSIFVRVSTDTIENKKARTEVGTNLRGEYSKIKELIS